jgi:integrase
MNDKLKTLSRASVKRIMSTLKKILFDAMKHKSPAADIKLPSAERVTYMLLTDKEVDRIHEDVKGTKDEPIILLAAWCGLRRGEIFALKWDDVNWTEGILRIDESRCVTSENTYIDKRPKSENGVRSVVVPEDLLGLLLGLKKAQMKDLEKKKKKKKEKTSAVILEKELTGARIFEIRPDSWSSYFAELVTIKGWPPVRFHDLRHYHASWLYDKGIPDHYAAERLGHDVQILKSIYQHLQASRRTEIDSNLRQLHKNL